MEGKDDWNWAPNVTEVPIVTAPGQRPLLDLFPVFFPNEFDPEPAAPLPPGSEAAAAIPLTYEPFFGLLEPPFAVPPARKFLFHSRAYDRAEGRVLAALGRRDRLVVVTGESGTGKTMLCQVIVQQLDRRTVASLVADPVVSLEELFEALLTDFGVISRGRLRRGSRADLSDALRDFLASLARIQTSAVVVVDDAQNLSVDILHGLRMLVEMTASDEAHGQTPLLQLILAGDADLLSTLRKSELQPIVPKLPDVAILEPIDADEVPSYVRHRLSVAGNAEVAFEPAAIQRVTDCSFGVPRLINQLCDRALAEAHRASLTTVNLAHVTTAAEAFDVAPAAAPVRGLWSGMLTGLAFTLLLLLGAALAAYVFRDDIAAILSARS